MKPESKKEIIQILHSSKGDDLERARHAFSGMSKKQMQEQHGNSGFTREHLLRIYEKREEKIDALIEEVRSA